jgi:hypothetical protein
MSGHTPGPWRIEKQDIYGNDKNGYICTWSGRSGDAKLIAAAPDLLEALEDITDRFERCIKQYAITDDDEMAKVPTSAARAVIAKARGKP